MARRTRRVIELLQLLGHTAGGRPGEMLAARFAIPASDNTILRQLKRWAANRATAAVRVVGIDDWSWRKGWTYGTIIVDLEQHDVVEVIAERSMETATDWFTRHPEVEIVCRDRCGLYSQGAREGAPQARQVVDRFHVLQNLREAIEHQMSRVSRFAGRSLLTEADSRGASGLDDDLQPSRRRDCRKFWGLRTTQALSGLSLTWGKAWPGSCGWLKSAPRAKGGAGTSWKSSGPTTSRISPTWG